MEQTLESIASRLRKALSLRNMKQQELVEKTGMPKSSICQYLSGYAEPKTDRVYAMAIALNVDPVWLMGFNVPMEPEREKSEKRLTAQSGALISAISNTPELMRLAEDFIQLNQAQRESVLALVHSMIPDTHQGQ